MKASKSVYRSVLWAALLLVGFWGCAGKPFDPPTPGELPEGPGVFTKGDGAAVLYDSKKVNPKSTAVETAPPHVPADQSKPPSEASFEEYEAYRKWLEWKKSAGDTSEYEEFRQWREWRQYQQWKKRQP